MSVFVDTSALLAVLDANDPNHSDAQRLFSQLVVGNELVTHNYVQVEAAALVRSRLGPEASADLADRLLPSMISVWVDEGVHRVALEAWRAREWAGSFVDEVSFVVMRRMAIATAFAYDRDFLTAGFGQPTLADPEPRRIGEETAVYGPIVGPDLVSVAEIARLSGRSVSTVQSWRRRNRDFPAALADLATGPIWSWRDVQPWIQRRAGPPRSGAAAAG